MERTTGRTARNHLAIGIGCTILFASAAASAWALQSPAEPVLFRPNGVRKEVSLPRGDVLLFQFLQAVADSTSTTVCYKGDDAPETTIHLPRALDKIDAKTASEVLQTNGYELSAAEFKGKTVSWVQKLILPPRTKGRILRGDEKKPEEEAKSPEKPGSRPGESLTPAEEARSSPGGRLSLYTRENGAGARYVVTFETDSRKEADDAISLWKAHRQARLTGSSAK